MPFPTTEYFRSIKERQDRAFIEDDWVQYVIDHPIHEEVQLDGRIRRWARIEEANDRYLRVVLLEDGETVHNAFFDRRFKDDQ